MEENNFFKGKNLYAYQKNKNALQALLLLIERMCEGVASGKYGIAVFTDPENTFDAVWRKGHYISCTKQVSLTIFSQSFPAFSLTDSIKTLLTLTPVTGLAPPMVFLRDFFSALLYSWF